MLNLVMIDILLKNCHFNPDSELFVNTSVTREEVHRIMIIFNGNYVLLIKNKIEL